MDPELWHPRPAVEEQQEEDEVEVVPCPRGLSSSALPLRAASRTYSISQQQGLVALMAEPSNDSHDELPGLSPLPGGIEDTHQDITDEPLTGTSMGTSMATQEECYAKQRGGGPLGGQPVAEGGLNFLLFPHTHGAVTANICHQEGHGKVQRAEDDASVHKGDEGHDDAEGDDAAEEKRPSPPRRRWTGGLGDDGPELRQKRERALVKILLEVGSHFTSNIVWSLICLLMQ